MKFFFQHKNTFIRTFDEFGYILNQRSGKEFRFNSIGSIFLKQLGREIKRVDDSVNEMLNILEDVDFVTLNKDFIDFLIFLETVGLVVLGNSKREIFEKVKYIEDGQTSPNINYHDKLIEYGIVSSEESYYNT